jgi:hypothetical protein
MDEKMAAAQGRIEFGDTKVRPFDDVRLSASPDLAIAMIEMRNK